jgi:peroxiredoxin
MRTLLLAAIVYLLAIGSTAAAAEFATQPAQVRPLLIGSALPDAALRDLDGKSTTLRTAAAGKPTVLVFYRGGWCPYCNLQLSDLRKVFGPLRELGYTLIAISPDRPEELRRTLEKTPLEYTLLSDSSAAAIGALGIGFAVDAATLEQYKGYGIDLESASGNSHHVLPVPSVFVVDSAGIIQFHYVNPDYRIRVPGELVLAAARAALSVKPLR